MNAAKTVVIVGASNKPDRYSYRAFTSLRRAGHKVIPVHPILEEIEGVPVFHSLTLIKEPVDTVTLYVAPERLSALVNDIIALHPRRVIFNPGTESADAEKAFEKAGIQTVQHCTLIMLGSGEF